MSAVLLPIILVFLVALAWLCITEFSYFGPRAVQWVYDWTATTYGKKWNQQAYSDGVAQRIFLAHLEPVLAGNRFARVLDLACGTGRMSLILLRQPWFIGKIEAVDVSPRMLDVFRQNLASCSPCHNDRIVLKNIDLTTWCTAPDDKYDVVAFIEASELVPGFDRIVGVVTRCLKPGGLFLLTKPPDLLAWLFVGRKLTSRRMQSVLKAHGFERVSIVRWRWRYSVVLAWKKPRNEITAPAEPVA